MEECGRRNKTNKGGGEGEQQKETGKSRLTRALEKGKRNTRRRTNDFEGQGEGEREGKSRRRRNRRMRSGLMRGEEKRKVQIKGDFFL